MSPRLLEVHLIFPLVILLHDPVGIFLVDLGIVIGCACVDQALPISISCGICHLVSLVQHLLTLLALALGVDPTETLKETLFVGLGPPPILALSLVFNELPLEHRLFIDQVIGEFLFLDVEIPHLLSLVHHLEGDWVQKMVSCLIYLDPLFFVNLMVDNVLLHHFHDLDPLLLLCLLLLFLVLFKLRHLLCYFLSVFFNIGCFFVLCLLCLLHLLLDAVQELFRLLNFCLLFLLDFVFFDLVLKIVKKGP